VAPLLTRWIAQAIDDGQRIHPEVRAWVEAVRAEAASSDNGTAELRADGDVGPSLDGIDIDTNGVADRLGCGVRNVTALAGRGVLPGRKVGGRWRFSPADVDEHRERRRAGA